MLSHNSVKIDVPHEYLLMSSAIIFKIENGNGVNFKPEIWHIPLISINDAKFITVDKTHADNNLDIYNFTDQEKFSFNG